MPPQAYDEWKQSHHANAQRDLNPALDDAVFSPRKEIAHGSQTSYSRKEGRPIRLHGRGAATARSVTLFRRPPWRVPVVAVHHPRQSGGVFSSPSWPGTPRKKSGLTFTATRTASPASGAIGPAAA